MKLLAIETATEACSIAVWIDGEVRERHALAPRRHAELALPWAEELLAEAGIARSQLDAVAVGRGPGAFTGVRLAVALAQGIALALDRPVLPVSTLAALAWPARLVLPVGGQVLASIDARMQEVYLARFDIQPDGLRLLGEETVQPPADVVLPDTGDWAARGTGLGALDAALAARLRAQPGIRLHACEAEALPHAADVAALAAAALARGEGIAPERLEPAYLRNQVALTLVEQQAARAAKG